jgi:hypothetical protein
VVLVLLPWLTGCPETRTSNQGGGSIVSAASKLAGGNVGDMTADEWQIAADNLPMLAEFSGIDVSSAQIPQITDEQAQAIVDFLAAYNIRTLEDLYALDFEEVEIPEVLQSLVDLFV